MINNDISWEVLDLLAVKTSVTDASLSSDPDSVLSSDVFTASNDSTLSSGESDTSDQTDLSSIDSAGSDNFATSSTGSTCSVHSIHAAYDDTIVSSDGVNSPSIDNTDTSDASKIIGNSPHLPAEIMEMIFKLVKEDSISSLVPILRTSKSNYDLAMPLLYSTFHLNRNTLPRLAKYISMSTERKTEQFGRVTTLVIDDIGVMFGYQWEDDLKIFCESVILPNVDSVVWLEEDIRESDITGPKPRYKRERTRNGKIVNRSIAYSPSQLDYHFRVILPKRFRSVLPHPGKSVLIILPPSGRFKPIGPIETSHIATRPWRQTVLTTERIMKYISNMSGNNTLEIHQPINSQYLTLSEIPNTNYTFYYDDNNQSPSTIKSRLIASFEKTVSRRLTLLEADYEQWKTYLVPTLRDIFMRDVELEEMMEACVDAVRNPPVAWSTRYKDKVDYDLGESILDMIQELMIIFHAQQLVF
jgi:hypothetical protein